jgi:hypothetical protein
MGMIKAKKWNKYIFEFLSIFLAVIFAFALNNWNGNRKDRYAENKILSEINIGLARDLKDIKENKSGHKIGLKAVNYFTRAIANKPVSKDSLLIYYFSLTRDFISIQNISGYETLKSKGLELIQNDSLRSEIISIYEYDYNTLRKLEENYYELQFHENYFKEINYILSQNLQFNQDKQITGINIPLELEKDKEKLILTYLWQIQSNRNFILRYYNEVENKIKELKSKIENELKP